jgi:hypothetical protein
MAASLPDGQELVQIWQQEPRDDQQFCRLALDIKRQGAHAQDVIEAFAMDAVDIAAAWERNRDRAALDSTWMHWTFEAWLN